MKNHVHLVTIAEESPDQSTSNSELRLLFDDTGDNGELQSLSTDVSLLIRSTHVPVPYRGARSRRVEEAVTPVQVVLPGVVQTTSSCNRTPQAVAIPCVPDHLLT